MDRVGRLVGLSATLAISCGSSAAQTCTLEGYTSVVVSIADENGVKVKDADVRFSLDGGPAQPCELFVDTYECGADQSGSFAITASKMGYQEAHGTVSIVKTDDGCHVITKQLVLWLTPGAK
jgi:hypothetical protein